MVTVTPHALDHIGMFLLQKGLPGVLRIELQSTGCCDASLGLMVDKPGADDLREDVEDITFIVSPAVYELTGDIVISCSTDALMPGYVITSENPVSEWSGFGVCNIKY